uniref:Uncharacterized protein n=1 Tax=Timema cristinae TaxID=61476 RepID=A0A7R9GZF8_TIMCR|nr:unnamed protein product [Timema cristinae]
METCDISLVKQEIVELIKTEPQNEYEFDMCGQSGIKTETPLYTQRNPEKERRKKGWGTHMEYSGTRHAHENIHREISLQCKAPPKLGVGLLSETTQNLSTLVNQVLNERSGRDQNSTDRSVELDGELLRTHDTMNTLQSDLDKKIEELKQQTEVVVDLTSKLTIREAELASVTEERDQARADLMDTYLAQDEVVQKAREARDKAMSRKNMVEIQLAKTRVEMMQTSSQLMEAIQQKVGLSQQLEEWQLFSVMAA